MLFQFQHGQIGLAKVNKSSLVTWNSSDKGSAVTLSNGNLTAQCDDLDGVRATLSRSSGENRFFEVTYDSKTSFGILIGIANASANVGPSGNGYPGADANGWGYWAFNGRKYNNAVEAVYGASFTTGDVIGVHLNNGALAFYKNGTSQGTAFTGIAGYLFPMVGTGDSSIQTVTANFGASAFSMAIPGGARSWDGKQ